MSFSAHGFGEVAFGEAADVGLDDPAFQAFLDRATAKRCWLLELEPLSLASVGSLSGAFSDAAFGEMAFADGSSGVVSGVTVLRYSSHGYRSRLAADAIDAAYPQFYDGRISGDITVERRIAGRDGVGGLARVFAEVRLVNADGALDAMSRDYSIEGRPVRILLGEPDAARSTFGTVFSGVVESVVTGLDFLTLKLSDGIAKLDAPIATDTYAGTGGAEGGADLEGKPKPVCLGEVYNVPAPLVNSATLMYQVHDGAISAIDAVYDRGIALAYTAGVPGAGQYSVDLAAGTFTLGATPDGTVTADARGDASLSGYLETTAHIVLRALVVRAGLYSSEIDPASVSNLAIDAPGAVGVWIGTEVRTVASVVDELLAGIGAFGGFSRMGAFTVGRVAVPGGSESVVLDEVDILSMEREPLPAPVQPIIWRARVGWQKNYTVQDDLADAVPAARRVFAAAPWRVVSAESASIKSQRLLARDYGPTESLYADSADAETEAQRLYELWAFPRALYRVGTHCGAMTRDLGQVIRLKHPRMGLAAGLPGRVIGHTIRGTRVELLVLT